jgi:hypothetical protein
MSQSPGPPTRPPRSPSEAPPRPALSVPVPSPLEMLTPTPRAVVASFLLWLASLVVGFAVVGYAYTRFDELRPALRSLIQERDSNITAESLEQVVSASLYVALGTLLAFVVVELLLLAPMHRGRNWARILLATVGLVSAPTFILVRGVLAAEQQPVAKDYILLGLGLQTLLMLLAVVAMFLPSASAWFRRDKVPAH